VSDDRVEVVGLDHVLLAMPPGGAAAARTFYGGVLGLREVPVPPELAGRAGCWFVGDGLAIHIGVEEPFVPARKAHPALLIRDLERARVALTAARVDITEDTSGFPVRRCYVADPFGNRIELIDSRDGGFTDPR
jgi:catechol 2,3-dioxygenase-like lactoylglutathione lyase family enzyme